MHLRRLFQFRLWMLMLLITAMGVTFGALVPIRNRYYQQHESLTALGGKVRHVGKEAPSPEWLTYVVDEEYFYEVVHLSFQGVTEFHPGNGFGDEDMVHLANFPALRRLSLQSTDVTDVGLRHISKLKQLNTLSLESTSITSEGLVHLKDLKRLKSLNVMYSSVRRLHHLTNLVALSELWCGLLTNDDFDCIEKLPRFEKLRCWLDEDASLSDMPNLRHLAITSTEPAVTLRLTNLPRLTSLAPPYGRQITNVELKNVPLLNREPK